MIFSLIYNNVGTIILLQHRRF